MSARDFGFDPGALAKQPAPGLEGLAAPAPAPWDWQGTTQFGRSFHLYITDANGRKIAAVWGPPEEKVLTGNLMRAAPDLYAACGDWIAWLDSDLFRDDAADYEAGMLNAMRSALARARGKR